MSRKQKPQTKITTPQLQQSLKLLTSEEAAVKLKISLPTLRRMRINGSYHGATPPPYIIVGNGEREGIRYIEHELDEWILSQPRFNSVSHIS
ncbi:helix-turn-helix domain-containing protein [Cloacibacillus evryensis]|uniref:helix-turn-helix domain-containing protein n=1 Tax=Cloacibacillus evryensis TaxID=508460 RepID=UPI003969D69B